MIPQENGLKWSPVVLSRGPLDGVNPLLNGARSAGPGSSWHKHFDAWEDQVNAITELGAESSDISHVVNLIGHDSMEIDHSLRLFESILQWHQDETNWPSRAPFHFETHRAFSLFSPWITRRIARV